MAHIVITGANQGIGYFFVEQLLKDGNKVAVFDLAVENLEKLKSVYESSLLYYLVDVRKVDCLNNAVKDVISKFDYIDIAVHNACKCTYGAQMDTDLETYRDVLEVNYFGALGLAKSVLPHMIQRNRGKVIFTSSGVGVTGFAKISPYASSKGAIESLAKCLRIEYDMPMEIGKAAADFSSWVETFNHYGERFHTHGNYIAAATCFRAAQFYTLGDERNADGQLKKISSYERCMAEYDIAYRDLSIAYQRVPYGDKYFLVLYLRHEGTSKGNVVMHGGYDSFIQEFVPYIQYIYEHGYDVYMFEGFIQGLFLSKISNYNNLTFTVSVQSKNPMVV